MYPSSDKKKRAFFFLVVDDGGFERIFPDNRGSLIDFSAYKNLVRLADSFDIQIVLACTVKFLDIHRVTKFPAPHVNSKRLISFLESHFDKLVLADHGYDHQFGKSYCEFYDYVNDIHRSATEQAEHIDQNIDVYRSLKWEVPDLFVAPAHGWEPGVTDRLYAARGIRYLSSYLWIKHPVKRWSDILSLGMNKWFKPKIEYPSNSNYLEVLPRLGLGLPSDSTSISRLAWIKAYHSVVPTGLIRSILIHRRMVRQPHNYAVHIANFSGDSKYKEWSVFLENLNHGKVYFPKTYKESIRLWKDSYSFINQ